MERGTAPSAPRRGLRRRWTSAFTVLLVILLATGVTAALLGRRVFGAFDASAKRSRAATAITTDLRRAIFDQEHAAYSIMNGAPLDIDAFLAEQAWIDHRFTVGSAAMYESSERGLLADAHVNWTDSLTSVHLWGAEATAPRDGAALDEAEAVLAQQTGVVLDLLGRLDVDVQEDIDQEVAHARHLNRIVVPLFAALFLLVLAAAFRFARVMKKDVLSPVSALRTGVAGLRDGGYADRVELDEHVRSTEIGELAAAFNVMAEAVRDRQQAVEDTLRELRDVQRQRDALLRRTLTLAEQERTRVAGALHDGPIQRLAALSYAIDATLLHDDSGPTAARTCLASVRARMANEVEALRRLMTELRPPVLDHGGLATCVTQCAGTFAAETGIAVEVSADLDGVRVEPDVATVAYRLLQEALTNVRAHAAATTVTITVTRRDGHLVVTVVDDGRGFDPTAARRSGDHVGLAAIAERVTGVGGRLRVHSRPGDGTTVEAYLPVATESRTAE